MTTTKRPELPEGAFIYNRPHPNGLLNETEFYYTADQLLAYGEACRATAPAEVAGDGVENPRRFQRVIEALVKYGDVSQGRVDTVTAALDSIWGVAGKILDTPAFDRTRAAIDAIPADGVAGWEWEARQYNGHGFVLPTDEWKREVGKAVPEYADQDMWIRNVRALVVATRPAPGRDGFVMVPLEPTDAMVDAALKIQGDDAFAARAPAVLFALVKIYRSMIAAAPAPRSDV